MLCVGIALAAPASADVTDVSGSGAFGESVNLPGVLTTGLLEVSTQGSNLGSHQGTSTSSAQVNGTTLLAALAPCPRRQPAADGGCHLVRVHLERGRIVRLLEPAPLPPSRRTRT